MSTNLPALAAKLGQLLINHQQWLTTAESCTGGGLGYFLTMVPGSSNWYERGFITYSNESKIELLQVRGETLNKYGAVSEETAREMAEGALRNSRAHFSIAITGIAGPDGGTPDKPVGTVWWAIAGKTLPTQAKVNVFPGDRTAIRLGVIEQVMEQLISLLT